MTELPKPDMDPAVRAFLERLDADDVPILEAVMNVGKNLKAIGIVGAWIFGGMIGIAILVSQGIDAFQKIAAAFKPV